MIINMLDLNSIHNYNRQSDKAERKTKHNQVECYDALQIPAGMRSTKIMKIF